MIEQQRRIHELEMRNEQAQTQIEMPAPKMETTPPPPPPPVREEREERAAPPPAPRVEERQVEQPRIDPKLLLESAGLVMIETDRSKVQVQAPVVEEASPVGRPRRERPKPTSQEGDLVQIETRK